MVLYNDTLLNNATDLFEMTKEINTLSNNLLGTMFLASTALFLLMIFKNQGEFKQVALGVMFITSLVGIGLLAIEFITFTALVIPLMLLMVLVFINIWS